MYLISTNEKRPEHFENIKINANISATKNLKNSTFITQINLAQIEKSDGEQFSKNLLKASKCRTKNACYPNN